MTTIMDWWRKWRCGRYEKSHLREILAPGEHVEAAVNGTVGGFRSLGHVTSYMPGKGGSRACIVTDRSVYIYRLSHEGTPTEMIDKRAREDAQVTVADSQLSLAGEHMLTVAWLDRWMFKDFIAQHATSTPVGGDRRAGE